MGLFNKISRYISKVNKRKLLLKASMFMKLKKCTSKKYVYLNVPRHSNIGDQAIYTATMVFLKKYFNSDNIFCFSGEEYCLLKNDIFKCINKDDVIIVQGGGSIGSLWPNEHNIILNILKKFKLFKIVIFPQTIFFYESDANVKQKFLYHLNHTKHLHCFVRDKKSFDFFKKHEVSCQYRLVPDIVFSLSSSIVEEKKYDILLCFRHDCEKKSSLNNMKEKLIEYGYTIFETDMVSSIMIEDEDRQIKIDEKMKEFSSAKLVITDRLHAMIFSTILEVPCIAMDNVSKKVSGVFEWIKDLDYIRCIDENELDLTLIKQMISKKNIKFSNEKLNSYFDEIYKCIKG